MYSNKYFSIIGMDNEMKDKVDSIKGNLSGIVGFAPQKVFVCDYIKTDGTRVFENILFFSNDIVFEVKNINADERYNIIKLTNKVAALQFLKNDNNLRSFNDDSKLHLRVVMSNDLELELKATGENCKYLMEIINAYLINNFT